jgi:hypothetical protein
MPIDAKELQAFAKRNCVAEADEVSLRASASRAYYAAYHALLPFAEKLPPSSIEQLGATHLGHSEMSRRLKEWHVGGLSSKLKGMTVTGGQLALSIRALRQTREVADYRLGATLTYSEADQQIDRARLVLSKVLQIQAILDPPKIGSTPAPANATG